MKKIKALIIADKTFRDIMRGKISHVTHIPSIRWKNICKEEHVILTAWKSGDKNMFKIIKAEITHNLIKIHVKDENATTRTALHDKPSSV